jgi:hypothetical protein
MASVLQVEELRGSTTGANANKIIIPSGQTLIAQGHVIQVVQTVETTVVTENLTSGNFGSALMATTITPTSTSSKILVDVVVHGVRDGLFPYSCFSLYRGGSVVSGAVGDASGSRPQFSSGLHMNGTTGNADIGSTTLKFLDSPNTDAAVTYDVRMFATGSGNVSINRTRSDNNDAGGGRTISTLTLMEIAG